MAEPFRHLFVVPGDEMVRDNPELLPFLKLTGTNWEQFLYLCLNSVLDHVNRHGVNDLMDFKGLTKQEKAVYCEEYLVEVMEGLDYIETGDDYIRYYRVLEKAVEDVLAVSLEYIPKILTEPRHAPGMPYALDIQRTIGLDVVFIVSYLLPHKTKDASQ